MARLSKSKNTFAVKYKNRKKELLSYWLLSYLGISKQTKPITQ